MTPLSAIGRGGEGDLDAGDGHAAFADSGSTTFHRAGTDIAGGKNAGKTGLERTRRAHPLRPIPS